ncbi:dysbindin-like [Brienomyrus brachyistius]|uniref:dysbindin-like n=1 Tax=Brienomyrus brachyistius TaxID=42636 RepID=UPI0020B2BBE1|nr:dysbindin-like [Brienomyrus brachyistius]
MASEGLMEPPLPQQAHRSICKRITSAGHSSFCSHLQCTDQDTVMSSSGSTGHNKHLSSKTEHAPTLAAPQQAKWRERQRFLEDAFQHDADVHLPAAWLQIEHKRPAPAGSISSMEVNIDMLEQMDLMDVTDQEALDVFFNSVGEEGLPSPPSSGIYCQDEDDDEEDASDEVYKDDILLKVPQSRRISSTSSGSSDPYSLDTTEEGAETPIVQSDNEEGQGDTLTQEGAPPFKDAAEKDKASLLS